MLARGPSLPTSRGFRNPVISGAAGEDHGDPFVTKYLDSFYLYHSGETAGRRGISVHRSADLVDWEFQGYALEPAEAGWAWSDLWAPEVVYERGVFYMYVSATRRRVDGSPATQWQQGEGDDASRRLGVARSHSPVGPFVLDPEPLTDGWAIDGHPFRDDDGTMWLFYNVRTADLEGEGLLPGTGTVCDRLLAPDRLEGSPTPVTLPSDAWEGVPTRTGTGTRPRTCSSGAGAITSSTAAARSPTARTRSGSRTPAHSGARGARTRATRSSAARTASRGPATSASSSAPTRPPRTRSTTGTSTAIRAGRCCSTACSGPGDAPKIAGPTDDVQPLPPGPVVDPGVPHWRAEAWVRGGDVSIGGTRYPLDPAGVWHQVEVVQADGRYAVRVGGVLRASRPGSQSAHFQTDGEVAHQTVTSVLQDELVHELPRAARTSGAGAGAAASSSCSPCGERSRSR